MILISWLIFALHLAHGKLEILPRPLFTAKPTPTVLPNRLGNDPESRLAMGERLDLSEADQFSLELIPGIGSGLAHNLLTARAQGTFECRTRHKLHGLQRAKGIGAARATQLERWLEIPACPVTAAAASASRGSRSKAPGPSLAEEARPPSNASKRREVSPSPQRGLKQRSKSLQSRR